MRTSKKNFQLLFLLQKYSPLLVCIVFFLAYLILSLIRHAYYGSFAADLGWTDNLVWKYSRFDASALQVFSTHIEFIYLLMTPLYWLWADSQVLIVVQTLVVCSSGIPIFLFAKRKKLSIWLCYALLLSYLTFYGIQEALWFDVHSSALGAAFLSWFVYFFDKEQAKGSIIFFVLTIISKENFAAFLLLICLVYLVLLRRKFAIPFLLVSFLYLFAVFGLYFPHFTPKGYGHASSGGLLSGNPLQLIDTEEKRQTIFYSFAWVGFLPLLNPLFTFPVLGNLASYFILGREYTATHGLFMHYRIDLAPLLFFATIFALAKYRRLNNKFTALYLLTCLLFFQYTLHLPLSYLAKRWFWATPRGVTTINTLSKSISRETFLVAQNNIYPHVSDRPHISVLWPDKREFKTHSPCGQRMCTWFRWEEKADYIIVDLSPEWDIRHFLQNREAYLASLSNMEKTGFIKKDKQLGTTVIYKILKQAHANT